MKSPRAFTGLLLGALALSHHGAAAVEPCEDLVACPAVVDEVCGSNGRTYSNECVLRMDQCKDLRIVLVARGACPTPPTFDCPVILCPSVYEPVCGTDGKTYPSECSLNADKCSHPGLSLAYEGECGEPAEPVTTATPAPATPSACDDSVCTADGTPICGTDGKTYANICHLTVATCRDASVKGRHYGECGGARQCDLICAFEDDPVCGSDGETYENPCALQAASCKAVAAGGRPLEFTSKGECVPTDTNPQTDDTTAPSTPDGTAPVPTPTSTAETPIGAPNELPPGDELPIGQPTDIDEGDDGATTTTAPTGPSPVVIIIEPATPAPAPEPSTAPPADVTTDPPVVIVVEPAPTTPAPAPSSDELPIGQPSEVNDDDESTDPPSSPSSPPTIIIKPRTEEPTSTPAPVSDASTETPTETPAPAPAPEPEPTTTPPASVDSCDVPCPMHSNFLVCATNGATFSSLCELSIAICRDGSLSAAHPGECVTGATVPPQPWDKEFDQCAFMCPMLYDPVCTELGQAFDNKCIYASAFCRDPTLPVATAANCGALVRIPVPPTTSSSP
ncbi:hypothetical protein PINS_up013685 [Pythium insidiosum]|nr:hypothetical protein PINS_up013685 [Pythium insidiosum]